MGTLHSKQFKEKPTKDTENYAKNSQTCPMDIPKGIPKNQENNLFWMGVACKALDPGTVVFLLVCVCYSMFLLGKSKKKSDPGRTVPYHTAEVSVAIVHSPELFPWPYQTYSMAF